MKIITAGSAYADIDVYGGCIAYAELWQKLGTPAVAVTTAPLNTTIPPLVREWPVALRTRYSADPNDTFTLIDVSNPDYFESFVVPERIDEVIDHHPGFEAYWQERIGDMATIERVGAACTQICEKWEGAGKIAAISETSARLLMCGILDNTLNFGAEITTVRDKQAYEILSKYANLPTDWPARYFSSCQESIVADLGGAVAVDTKIIDHFKTYPRTVAVGQLSVWDASQLARQGFDVFKKRLQSVHPDWFMNVIGISDRKSHIISDVPEVRDWLSALLHVRFDGNVAIADQPWLRKEIMQADIQAFTQK